MNHETGCDKTVLFEGEVGGGFDLLLRMGCFGNAYAKSRVGHGTATG